MTTKFDTIKLKAQAALGNAEALYKLGVNYLYGISLDVDIEKAHDFLVKSAEKDFESAKTLLKNVFANNGMSSEIEPDFKENGYDREADISYAIVDDLNDMLPEQQNHFVEIDPRIGFSENDAKLVSKLLNG